jgi:hypothetical protein
MVSDMSDIRPDQLETGRRALDAALPGGPRHRGVQRMRTALAVVCWGSAAFFAVYIAVFYCGALVVDSMNDWNAVLPRLYAPGMGIATGMMGLHMAAGAALLLLGPIQFFTAREAGASGAHRWGGRVYAAAALLAGIGGLVYIARSGTVGGTPMTAGFSIYGVLMIVASVETVRHARAHRIVRHRAWAIRLFALAIGSWLYRMDYGVWLKAVHGPGHLHSFQGPFDVVMSFFFYVPNLIVAEALIRRQAVRPLSRAGGVAAVLALGVTTLVTAAVTYLFAQSYWWPHIVARFTG